MNARRLGHTCLMSLILSVAGAAAAAAAPAPTVSVLVIAPARLEALAAQDTSSNPIACRAASARFDHTDDVLAEGIAEHHAPWARPCWTIESRSMTDVGVGIKVRLR